MSKFAMVGIILVVAFFAAQIAVKLPLIGNMAQPVAQTGLLLPVGLGMLFLGSPKIMFIVIIGGLLFILTSGTPLIGLK